MALSVMMRTSKLFKRDFDCDVECQFSSNNFSLARRALIGWPRADFICGFTDDNRLGNGAVGEAIASKTAFYGPLFGRQVRIIDKSFWVEASSCLVLASPASGIALWSALSLNRADNITLVSGSDRHLWLPISISRGT
jgi:hypothetical protein